MMDGKKIEKEGERTIRQVATARFLKKLCGLKRTQQRAEDIQSNV